MVELRNGTMEKTQIIRERKSSLRDILNVLFRHKWLIFLFFIVVIVSVLAVTVLILPEIYQSEAKLLIRIGRESVSADPTVKGPILPVTSQSRENELNSEVAILTSRFLAEKVVDHMSPEYLLELTDQLPGEGKAQEGTRVVRRSVRGAARGILEFLDLVSKKSLREEAIEKYMKRLRVGIEIKSNIIKVSYEADSQDKAQEVLTNLIKYYMNHRIKVYGGQAGPAFFEEQTTDLRARLKEAETELEKYRAENHITAMYEQKNALIAQINTLRESIDRAIERSSVAKAKIAALEGFLKDRPRNIEIEVIKGKPNYAADTYKRRMIDLRLKEADLSARYPDDHRLLVDVRKQIALAQEALRKEGNSSTEVTSGLDENYQRAEMTLSEEKAEFVAQKAVQEALGKELVKRREALEELTSHEIGLASLVREVEVLEKEYLSSKDTERLASFSNALDDEKISNVSVVQPPTYPESPIKPRKGLNILMGLLLGLLGGVVAAFFVDYMDDSLKTNEEVEKRLGLPVITVISQEEFDSCT